MLSIYQVISWSYYVAPTPGFNSFDPDCESPAPTHIRCECLQVNTEQDEPTYIIGVKPLIVYYDLTNHWSDLIINGKETVYVAGNFDFMLSEEYRMIHPFD